VCKPLPTLSSVKESAKFMVCNYANHGLCGSNKLLYKWWALPMGNGELRPHTAPTFLDRSFWNSNLRNTSMVPPNMQNMVQIRIMGWAGRTPSLSLFLVLPFVFYRAMHFSAYARTWDRMSSVRLSVCDVGGLWSHRVEIFETNYTDN